MLQNTGTSEQQKVLEMPSKDHPSGLCHTPQSGAKSVRQSFSAFCSSSCQNLSTVGGSHSFSEAMLFFSVQLFRLKCSQHE